MDRVIALRPTHHCPFSVKLRKHNQNVGSVVLGFREIQPPNIRPPAKRIFNNRPRVVIGDAGQHAGIRKEPISELCLALYPPMDRLGGVHCRFVVDDVGDPTSWIRHVLKNIEIQSAGGIEAVCSLVIFDG
ncbi:hypothetical protein L6164_020593 [Bauhinia variegata]|uniref:Uncharacterized protein n=1 Tax=Bauhinia variegata TaxID=167791 RepID=A0ACB9N0G3_BAUVA|nr:hypothetical protein L6164_020593 [Bauhinia variegata]